MKTFLFSLLLCVNLFAEGLIHDPEYRTLGRFVSVKPPRYGTPPEWDLRDEMFDGKLLPIRLQLCGDCWDQAITRAIELLYKHKNKEDISLAVQEMISTCPKTGGSCNGGYFRALDYACGKVGPGHPLETHLPYKGRTTPCNKTVDKKSYCSDWAYLGARFDARGASIDEMKAALIKYKVLIVDVKSFSHKGSSVYTACVYGTTNHMVIIIGYVDDPKYAGGGYWKVMNSHGEGFGEKGIAKVAYLDSKGRKCAGLGQITAVITQH